MDVTSATAAQPGGKAVPAVIALPLTLAGFQLCNMADMACGTKKTRVRKGTGKIISEERALVVPSEQAPSYQLYPDSVLQEHSDVKNVSSYWPWAAKDC